MNLKAITRLYISRHRPRAQKELEWFRGQPMLRCAIEFAALATRSDGKRYSHQRRIPKATLELAREALVSHLKQIAQVQTFEELFTLIERVIEPIHGLGELYVYDTSLRIGAKLNLLPERVYLHAGTRVGAHSLGFHGNLKVIDVSELPPELQQLEPHEIEDVLCIFKDRLKRGKLGPNRLDLEMSSWCG